MRGQKYFVDAQALYADAEQGFSALSHALGLNFVPQALTYWQKVHHTIGGNFNPYSWLHTAPESLKLVPLPVHPVEEHILDDIRSHR